MSENNNNKEIKNKKINIDLSSICKKISGLIAAVFGFGTGLIKSFIAVFVTGLILCSVIGCLVYINIKPDIDECLNKAYDIAASMQEGDFMRGQDTYVYDKDGNTIGIINAGHFEYTDISHISDNIQNLYISQEDKRFKEHIGIDPISIARAGLALVKNNGEITQGGSTITQQVIKNTYLTQEQSFKRKIVEILVAPQLELKFTKPKIMEFYCNTNYYGNRCYGVQAASRYYFGKDASDVSIAEAAMLVGLSNAPSAYDPIVHPDKALEKRNQVIDNALNNGFITEEEVENAKNEPLTIVQEAFPETMETYQSTYAIHCAAIELMKKDGFIFRYTFNDKADYEAYMEKYDTAYSDKTNEIRSGGYKIYTSFDQNIQNIAQAHLDDILSGYTETQDNGKYALQGSMVIADNNSGYIVAVIGGRGTDDQFNRAYLSERQPGSCIKPLIDYAPAFDIGAYWPGSVINDHEFEGGPANAGSYYGNVTIREALNRSLNTVAWQVLQNIGVDTGLEYLGKMHFKGITYVDNGVAALSIGGFTNGLRPVDMAKGYQTLANNGIYDDKTCIVKIEDAGGEIIYDGEESDTEKVFEQDTAYMITDILKGTFTASGATGIGLGLSNMPAAGKTGTTNSNKDTWFCGYTKYYTASVWVGYDVPRAMPGVYGADLAGSIWHDTMTDIHNGLEPADWERPATVEDRTIDGITDLYSSVFDEKKAEKLLKQQEEKREADAEAALKIYETKTISSVEDTYLIENDFEEINNVISTVENSKVRTGLYDRAYEKYESLKKIKDDMADDIKYYEEQNAIKESEAAVIRESEAEAARIKQIADAKKEDFDNALNDFISLKYRPNNINDITENLTEKLKALMNTEYYESCAARLSSAINSASSLPSETEYIQEQERIAESIRAEESARESQEAQIQNEIESAASGLTESSTESTAITDVPTEYGPGIIYPETSEASPENYGPGFVNE